MKRRNRPIGGRDCRTVLPVQVLSCSKTAMTEWMNLTMLPTVCSPGPHVSIPSAHVITTPNPRDWGTSGGQDDASPVLYYLYIIIMLCFSWYNFDEWSIRHSWANRGEYNKFS